MRYGKQGIANRGLRAVGTIGSLAAVCVLALAGQAQAANVFTLDSAADSNGTPAPLVVDNAGRAYVGWMHKGAVAMFCTFARGTTCTSPQTLNMPVHSGASGQEPLNVFPVLNPAGTLYAVAPRYLAGDIVTFTSADGLSFDPNSGVPSSQAWGSTNATEARWNPLIPGFSLAGNNLGSNYYELSLSGSATGTDVQTGENPALALNPGDNQPVQAGLDTSAYHVVYAYRSGGVWSAPTDVGPGTAPELASGPSGLFMVSADGGSGSGGARQLEVRKWDGSGHSFGSPVALPGGSVDYYSSGYAAQTPGTGWIYVAWSEPHRRPDGNIPIELWVSKDGGNSFSGPTEVALASNAAGNIRLGVADDGQGFITFNNLFDYEVADLNPIPPFALPNPTPSPPPPAPTPAPPSHPYPYISIVGSLKLVHKRIVMTIVCQAAANVLCVGTMDGTARQRAGKTVRVGLSGFVLQGGERRQLTLGLNGIGWRLLRRSHRLPIVLTSILRDVGGRAVVFQHWRIVARLPAHRLPALVRLPSAVRLP